MRLFIVIPAFNESAVIRQVLKSLPRRIRGIKNINTVVVDDGSWDDTAKIAKGAKVEIITHTLNRGAGAATKTGLEFAKRKKADIAVTFDADGQHDAKDIERIIMPIVNKKADLVIGSRLKKTSKMPVDRLILNWFANFATFLMFGVFSTDSQSGLRAFSKKAINLIKIKSDRMEFSTEILLEAKRNKLKVTEIPIKAIYTSYSRSKGQKNTNAIPIFTKYLLKFMR